MAERNAPVNRVPIPVQCYSFDAERLTAEAESPTVTCRQKANHRRWTVDSTAKSAATPSTMKSAMYLQHGLTNGARANAVPNNSVPNTR